MTYEEAETWLKGNGLTATWVADQDGQWCCAIESSAEPLPLHATPDQEPPRRAALVEAVEAYRRGLAASEDA